MRTIESARLYVSRPSSGDEFEDYNLMDLCDLSKYGRELLLSGTKTYRGNASLGSHLWLLIIFTILARLLAMSDELERVFSSYDILG